MADHTLNALRAAARAMDEVVIGAVDPTHPLAGEQARLVAKYLKLFVERNDLAYDRNRFELRHYLDLARALAADAASVSPAIAQAFDGAIAEGQRLYDSPGARLPALQEATRRLAGIAVALVRTAAEAEAPVRHRIEARVLDAAAALLAAQRAWFVPQGWEPDAREVPPIERALGLVA